MRGTSEQSGTFRTVRGVARVTMERQTVKTKDQVPKDEKIAALRAAVSALAGDDEPTEGPTMNISEVAKRAGVARSMVYRAIAAGSLRASPLYPGGRPRVRESDYREWVR